MDNERLPDEAVATVDEHGIPQELWPRVALWLSPRWDRRLTADGKPVKDLKDMELYIYGVAVTERPADDPFSRYIDIPPEVMGRSPDIGDTPVAFEVWEILVIPPGGPVRGTRRSPPGSVATFTLEWPAEGVTQGEITRVQKALGACGMVKRGGGPEARDDTRRTTHLTRIEDTTRRLLRAYTNAGEHLKQQDVAAALTVSTRTLLRHIRPKYRDWAELVSSLSDEDLEASL